MLNRLYIVVGFVAILILAAAFIVPSFIPWGNYRGRMETLAGEALGTAVRIKGDIHFSLLPAPHLVLADVAVGPVTQPVMSVASADADFSLIDFLRDRYTMTKLVLEHPVLDLKIDRDGSLDTGLKPPGSDAKTSLSVANAQISVGTIRVADTRSGKVYAIEGLDGDLTMGALRGPFGFTGGGSYGDQHYSFHLTSTALDKAGNTQVSLFAKPDGNAFSIGLEGMLASAGAPHFSGDLTYRQSPATGRDANGVIGDLTLAGKLDASPDRLVLPNYTLVPDENRAMNRLTGSATVDLGARPAFTATVTSNVLALPPRDATAEQGPQPYELVRMLGELPALPVPSFGGTISADVSELDLRSFALHNVKLVATTDGKKWSVEDFSGQLPGSTVVKLAGQLDSPDGRPSFSGTLSIASARLDTLSGLWRKPAPGNPLFNLPGSFQAKLSVLGQTMALTDGQLTIDGTAHALTALINFGADRRVDLSGQFKDLSAADSAALVALVPDLQQDPSAAVTFPQGAVSLSADSAAILGLPGKGLALEGKWANGSIELSKLSAEDLGGAGFDLSLALSGTLAAPRLAGDGSVTVASGGGPALPLLLDTFNAPPNVRQLLAQSLPADLKLHLDEPKDDGAQGLSVSGKVGAADVTVVAQLQGGLLKALTAPLSATLDVEAADPRALTRQLGLGDVSLLPETGPVKLMASVSGAQTASLQTRFTVEGGADSIDFDGAVTLGDLTAISGTGRLKLALSDTSAIAAEAGLAGITAPPVRGDADLQFAMGRSLVLDNFAGSSGATGFSGKLALTAGDGRATVSGALTLDRIDLAGLVAATGGPTALMTSAGRVWPDGPLALGDGPRTTTGSLAIMTPSLTLDGQSFIEDAGFDFGWDATRLGVHNFAGKLGGGALKLDVSLCCAGAIAEKQVSGEGAVAGVALSSLLPPGAAATLSGKLDGSARFNGSGDSIDGMLSGLSGDGSFTVADLAVQKFDPRAFAAVAATGNMVELDPKDLGDKVATALDAGTFSAPQVGGGFTVAGGTFRISNVAANAPGAKLFGSATVKLADLSLGGSFALSPIGTLDAAGLVSETTSKVTANLSGTLTQPQRTLDIADMVEAIKVKALELEVARLEALKAADDARQRAATAAG
ncbi:MAG: AsmA family protein, partial [Devosia sp.]|nr:AsmA family protein [Devosia sp.]